MNKDDYFKYLVLISEFLISVAFIYIGDISFLNLPIPLRLFGIMFMVLSIMSALMTSEAWRATNSF